MKEVIKKYIPESIRMLAYHLQYYLQRSNHYDNLSKDGKRIFVMMGGNYGNLGDSAITVAQIEFLKDHFPDYEVIEIPISDTFTKLKSLKRKISPQDIITITGGGFMGSLYIGAERQRQLIISKLRDNKIISFPQTIYFDNTRSGRRLEHRMSKIYSRHSNLTISARDEPSFKIMKRVFRSSDVILTPDIVLYLDKSKPVASRQKKVILCIRDDKESALGIDDRAALIKTASEKGLHVSHYDTHIGDKTLTSDQREKELNRIWGAFRESKLVITDRLHGMIFCAITNTPCIAINNNNGKVKDVYFSWLKDLNYIRITDHIQSNDISRMVDELTTIAEQTIAGPQLNNSFKGLTAERVE